jgi:hypothetical protein
MNRNTSTLAAPLIAALCTYTVQAGGPPRHEEDHDQPGVVKSLNGLEGKITIRADTNVKITSMGNSLVIGLTEVPSAETKVWHRDGDLASPGQFLGTLNDQPLELRVNNQRALRLEATTNDAPNLIGGASLNQVRPGAVGAVIAGGGTSNYFLYGSSVRLTNGVSSSYSFMGAGAGNEIAERQPFSSILGGSKNGIGGETSRDLIYGLLYDEAWNFGGGWNAIGGGGFNNISLSSTASVIAGGLGNNLVGYQSVIGGGVENLVYGGSSVIGGGGHNTNASIISFIGGGQYNFIGSGGDCSTVGGGHSNTIGEDTQHAFIGGGKENSLAYATSFSSITSGWSNHVAERVFASVIGGGMQNTNAAGSSVIAGGFHNLISERVQFQGGGAVIGGGGKNTVAGAFASVSGGLSNRAEGNFSFAGGRRAKADHAGTFVWGDSTDADVTSSGDNQFVARAAGGVAFFTSSNLTSGAYLAPGGGSWATLSDRDAKENVKSVDSRVVLEAVCALPLATWNYKAQDQAIRHIGPMAQDFHAAFGVGEDERHIASVDADGVALAAIQALNQKLEERNVEIQQLKKALVQLKAMVADLAAGRNRTEEK